LPFGPKGAKVTSQSLPAPFCTPTAAVVLPHETKVAGLNCSATPAAAAKQRDYWRQVYRSFVEKGWEGTIYDYTVDEPQAHEDIFGQQRWDILRTRTALVHAADRRIRTMVTAELPIVRAGHPELVSAIDIWCPVIGALDGRGSHENCTMMLEENGTKFEKAANYISNYSGAKTLWMYQACPSVGCGGNGCGHGQKDDPNSSSHPSSSSCIEGWPAFFPIDHKPVTSQRLMQWADFAYNVSGELYWGVLGQYGKVKQQQLGKSGGGQPDPTLLWKSQWTNGANGDGNLFYPGTPAIIGGKTHIPVESMRLKFVRDGIDSPGR
jgi:hypothetical protein